MKKYQYPHPMPQEGFARLPQVLHVLGIGKTSFWEGIKTGRFPAPVKLGPRTAVWRVEDIRSLIRNVAEDDGRSTD
ncbi:AlpA family phage regulatory protein [Deltaproteobacteria bacterium OttesenSCG-928-K17]|nr:AlpA family phage regulatory protein [Deltaproteobacteria bacterium OttesenSCG-928-K17]